MIIIDFVFFAKNPNYLYFIKSGLKKRGKWGTVVVCNNWQIKENKMQQRDYLTTNKIANYVGGAFYHRGVRYFKEDRVSAIELDGLEITGLVKGGGYKVYKSVINLDGRGGIKSSNCSCPIGGGCKHIAALGLAFLDWGVEGKEMQTPAEAKMRADTMPATTSAKQRTVTSKTARWRKEFDRIAPDDENSAYVYDGPRYDIELVFEVQPMSKYFNQEGNYALVLRLRGKNIKTGKKSFSAFEWNEFKSDYRSVPYYIPAPTYYFLKEFYRALVFGRTNSYYYRQNEKWLPFVNENAGVIWHFLKDCHLYNINLIFGSGANIPITISNEPITIKVVLSDIYRGFRLKNGFVCQEKILTPDLSILFGVIPRFALLANNVDDLININQQTDNSRNPSPEISLYPIGGNANMKVFQSLQEPISIPESDWVDFREHYLPKILRATEIHNLSQKVAIPKTIQPVLKIILSRHKESDLAIKWCWRYDSWEIALNAKNDNSQTEQFLRDEIKELSKKLKARKQR